MCIRDRIPTAQKISPMITRAKTPSTIQMIMSIVIIVLIFFPVHKLLGNLKKTKDKRKIKNYSNKLRDNKTPHNTEFATFKVVKDYTCTWRVYQGLFHGKCNCGHSPVSFNHDFFKTGRNKLHPVTGIDHHPFLELSLIHISEPTRRTPI